MRRLFAYSCLLGLQTLLDLIIILLKRTRLLFIIAYFNPWQTNEKLIPMGNNKVKRGAILFTFADSVK